MREKRVRKARRLSRRVLWDAACGVTDFAVRHSLAAQSNAYSCYRVRDAAAHSDLHVDAGEPTMRQYVYLAAWAGAPLNPVYAGELQELAHWINQTEGLTFADLMKRTNELRFDFLHLLSLSYEP